MDYRPRQTNDVLMIYYSSRIAHVLRDSASSRGLFQVAAEYETKLNSFNVRVNVCDPPAYTLVPACSITNASYKTSP